VTGNEEPRKRRLDALDALAKAELCHLIGEASLDLWVRGESWPELVDRCLEAVEEDAASGWVAVRVEDASGA